MDDTKVEASVNWSQIFTSPIGKLLSLPLFYQDLLSLSCVLIPRRNKATVGDTVCIGNQRFEVIAAFVVIWCHSKLVARLILRR